MWREIRIWVPWQTELPSLGSYHLETVSILQLPVGLDIQLMDIHVLCYLGLIFLTSQQNKIDLYRRTPTYKHNVFF
jgi:hypothetical protein